MSLFCRLLNPTHIYMFRINIYLVGIMASLNTTQNLNDSTNIKESDKRFFTLIGLATILSVLCAPYPNVARWVGFGFAAYAAVANDSIQTLGTFLASNKKRPWYVLWGFAAGIFLLTMTYSWMNYGGDVSYGRLASKGFDTAPMAFTGMQVAAPIILVVLTRLKMPVSTTLLLLTSFASEMSAVSKVIVKSLSGYVLAFVLAFALWFALQKVFAKWFEKPMHRGWIGFQWITTGVLWSVWLQQDAANIAVYLPRSLNGWEFIAFAGTVVVGLGWIFKNGGEKIQEVVEEKNNVTDIRAATIIDLLYAIILFYFKIHSKIPMSTTWVFLGLLAGRELAISIQSKGGFGFRTPGQAVQMLTKDAGMATIGLVISLIVAYMVNGGF